MAKANVLLTTFNICDQPHYYSLALGYLKAFALKDESVAKKANIEIVDFCVDCNSVQQVMFYLASEKPDIIAFSCYCWNMDKISDLCRLAKQIMPDVKIVLGGPEIGPITEEVLKENPAVDVVVRGEGEKTFSELLKYYLTKKGRLEDISGVSYRKYGDVFRNDDRPLIQSLDEIPSPYLTGVLEPREKVTYLETYRGCPFRCAYCYEGKNYPKLRYFSEERIRKEIELISQNLAVQSFSFVDPVFNLNRDKTRKLCSMLNEAYQGNNTSLHTIEVATELIDDETIEEFKKANVVSVETGPQTVVSGTLKNINRHFVPTKFTRGVKLLLKNNIKVLCDLIIGLPGDNLFRFMKSVAFVSALCPSTLIFSTLHVLPGTELYVSGQKFDMKFDAKPPHHILSNYTFPYEEIRKAEILAVSLAKEYNIA